VRLELQELPEVEGLKDQQVQPDQQDYAVITARLEQQDPLVQQEVMVQQERQELPVRVEVREQQEPMDQQGLPGLPVRREQPEPQVLPVPQEVRGQLGRQGYQDQQGQLVLLEVQALQDQQVIPELPEGQE